MWWSNIRGRRLGIALSLIVLATFPGCKLGFMGLSSAGKNASVMGSGPLPPSFLVMFGPTSVVSGVCSDLMTVMGMDSHGNPADAFPQGTVVSVSGAEANTVFLDSACTIPAVGSTVPVLPGTNRAEFFVKAIASGARKMAGSIPGMPDASGSMMVMAGAPAKLQINFPNTINSNTCVLGSLALLDINNNPTIAAFDITSKFTFNVNNGTAIYGDGTCDTVLTNGTVEAGLSSKNIWVFTPAATGFTVNMNPISNLAVIAKTIAVNAANMPKLVIQAPANMTAGVCTAFSVQTRYANNTAYKVRTPTAVQMGNNLASARYYSDVNCTSSVGNGILTVQTLTSTANFWMTATQATQNLDLTADSSGYTSGNSSTLINANSPTSLLLSGVPMEIPADRCSSALQVGLRDAFGNVAKAATQLTLTPEFIGDQLTFFTASDCGGNGTNALTINNAESVTSFYFKARNPGSAEIRVKSGALTAALSQPIKIKNALDTPNNIKLTGSAPNLSVLAGECVPIKISSFDANNFPLDVFPNDISFSLSSSGSTPAIFYSNASCTDSTTSVKLATRTSQSTFYLKNTKVDPSQPTLITAKSVAPALMATLSFTTIAAEPAQLEIVGNITTVPAATCNGLTVYSKDRFGNLSVPAPEMNVDLEGGQYVAFFSDPNCVQATDAIKINGQNFAPFWFKVASVGNLAAADPVTLVAIGPTGVAAGAKSVSVSPPTPIHIAITPPTTLKVGMCLEFEATSLDANNQPLIREPISLPINVVGGGSNPLFSNANCTTALPNNTVKITQNNNPAKFYFYSTASGNVSISADSGGTGSTSISFYLKPEAQGQVVFVDSIGPGTVDTDTCVGPYRVESRDRFGNLTPVTANLPVTTRFVPSGMIYSDEACTSSPVVFAGGSFTRDFYFKIGGNGTGSLTLNVGGFTDTRDFTILPPASIVFSVNGQAATAFDFGSVVLGSTSTPVTLTLTNSSNTKPLNVQSITVPSPFRRQGGTCPTAGFTLAQGSSCTLSADFLPGAEGGVTGAVNVAFTVSGVPASKQFLLSGKGTKPTTGALVFIPDSLNFGSFVKGDTKKLQVSLKNVGGGAATQIAFASSLEVIWENHSSCTALAEGEQCDLWLAISPKNSGAFSAQTEVGYYDGAANKKIKLPLSADVLKPAMLVLNVNPLNFEGVGVNQEKSLNVTVENRGALTATGVTYTLRTVTPSFVLDTGSCPTSIPVGGSCTMSVKFKPGARASFVGNVVINYKSLGHESLTTPDTVLDLIGSGYSMGELTFSPSSLLFPDTLQYSSRTLPITVKNSGDRQVSDLSLSLTANNPMFSIDKDTGCPQTLAPNDSCIIYASYSPTSLGSAAIKFKLGYNNSVAPVLSSEYEVTGTAVSAAQLVLTPSSLDLGTVPVGGTSATQFFTLKNVGGNNAVSILFEGPLPNSPFQVVTQGCPSALLPQAQCTVSVNFKAVSPSAQPVTQNFEFTYKSAAADQKLPPKSVVATASAVPVKAGSLAVEANTVDFGFPLKGSGVATKKLRFSNSGSFKISMVSIGEPGSPFKIRGGNCGPIPFSLESGAACYAEFDLDTTVEGTFNALAGIIYNDGANNVPGGTLTLKGTVGTVGKLVFPVSPLNVGQAPVSTKKPVNVTVSNTGNYPVTPGALGLTGPFKATLGTCSPVIAPKSDCQIALSFEPTSSGTFSGSLTLAYADQTNNVSNTSQLDLTGTGFTPGTLASDRVSYDFGPIYAGSSSTLPVILTNSGQGGVTHITASLSPQMTEFSIVSNGCSSIAVLDSGRSCTIKIQFAPSVGVNGTKTIKLLLAYDNELGNQPMPSVGISGTAVSGAHLTASVNPVDFATVPQNGTKSITFTLQNTGKDAAKNITLNVFKPNTAFTHTTTCPSTAGGFSLEPSVSCHYTVAFKPTNLGNHAQSFQFSYLSSLAPANTPNSILNVPISGTAVTAGGLDLSVSTIDFQSPVQNSAASKKVIVTNSGGVPTTNIDVTGYSSPFKISSTTCGLFPFTLTPNGSCEIVFAMNTATTGTFTQWVKFPYHNGVANVAMGPISIKGKVGMPVKLASTPTTADFSKVTSGKTATLNLTIKNSGDYPAEITSTSGLAAPFALDFSGCSPAIAPQSQCTVKATFTAGTAIGGTTQNVIVKYRDTANLTPSEFPLVMTAQVVTATVLKPSINSGNFELQVVNGPGKFISVVLQNAGPAAVKSIGATLVLPNAEENMTISGNTCVSLASLAPGSKCQIDVKFLPKSVGTKTATLNVSYVNEVGTTNIEPIAFKGVGITPAAVSSSIEKHDFGSVIIGKESALKTFTLTNSGQDAAKITITPPTPASVFALGSSNCPLTGSFMMEGNGGYCSYSLTFKPAITGQASTSFKFSYTTALGGASSTTGSISLAGTGVSAGRLTVSGSNIDFGKPPEGSAPSPIKYTITNGGGSTAVDIKLNGIVPPFAVLPGTCGPMPFSLGPNKACDLFLTVSTVNVGVYSASYYLSYNDGVKVITLPTYAMKLTVGKLSTLSITPKDYSFVSTPVGGVSKTTFSLVNTGDYDLTSVALGAFPAGMSGSLDCCETVKAKGTCTLTVTYKPTIPNQVINKEEVKISFRDARNALTGSAAFTLSGKSYNPGVLVPSPLALNFGSRMVGSTEVVLPIVMLNQGTSIVQNIKFSLPANDIGMVLKPSNGQSNYCSSTINLLAGSSCFVNIGFTAKKLGAHSVKLPINYSNELGAAAPVSIELKGTGISEANLVTSPALMDFGLSTKPILVNTTVSQNVTVSNTGGYIAKDIVWSTNASQVTITGGSCVGRSALAPQESCTVTLSFRSATPGKFPYLFSASYAGGLKQKVAQTSGTGFAALAGLWIATHGGNCTAVCAAANRVSAPDELGNYCTSGELVPVSAAPYIQYRNNSGHQCWPTSYNLPNWYCKPHGHPNGRVFGNFCYGETNGNHQKHDGDITDFTKGCFCI